MAHLYSLRKSRRALHWCYSSFKKKGKNLSQNLKSQFEDNLKQLEKAVFDKDRTRADSLARQAEEFSLQHFKKTTFEYVIEIGVAIILALIIATIVRQVWFEPYEIPTGSMRPSFREQDHLTVTKTAFGLNVPLKAKHFYFDSDLVRRTGVVIITGDNIPLPDQNTTYFGFIPYKKRYIKRLIGKPGDSLYFYGGKIYGIDAEGNPLEELLNDPWMEKLEHIPFLTFEGDISFPSQNQVLFKHMNLPVGKVFFKRFGTPTGEIFNGKEWIKDQSFESTKAKEEIRSFGDFWGMGNFAMARLLTKKQVENYTDVDIRDLEEGVLYLQLRHTPNLTYPPPQLFQDRHQYGIHVPALETIIPLQQKHLDAIMDNMYTSRFIVKNGSAHRYNIEGSTPYSGNARFSDVPDGTYEIYHGKAEQVGWKGKTSQLPETHPLLRRDASRVQELFNKGIDFSKNEARAFSQGYYPHRYAYFRNSDLYLMGAPILTKEDSTLIQFLQKEEGKERQSTSSNPYLAFTDRGPPLKNGNYDIEFIRKFGLTIPEKRYLVLGDNHAMSADSRVFGFAPEDNIRGAPSFLIWPPGDRWGAPPQTAYPFLTLPRLIVWLIALAIFITWYVLHRKRMSTRIFPE
ncbi:MAG: Signal peptidase I T [Chlamydiae bacterium]|nr:Signal peptidase I T [Chlamydiota bacterium]